MIKILDCGAGNADNAREQFKELGEIEVVKIDIDPERKPDLVMDITEPWPTETLGAFDIVYCCHVLEHIDRDKVFNTVKSMAAALKDNGELWLTIPSLEWCAREIIRGRDDPGVQGALYGGQWTPWEYHRVLFTLKSLRELVQLVGLLPMKVYQNEFMFNLYGKDYTALGNVVIARKVPVDKENQDEPVSMEPMPETSSSHRKRNGRKRRH